MVNGQKTISEKARSAQIDGSVLIELDTLGSNAYQACCNVDSVDGRKPCIVCFDIIPT